MTTPTLSVLLTVYQGERYLAAAVDSILNQSLTDLELLVIDDGSTDGTWPLLQRYTAGDARVRAQRNTTNQGITRSMNKLFPQAQGRYINRHDADDVSLPGRYARQVAFLDEHPAVGLVSGRVQVIGADGQPLERAMFESGLDNAAIQQLLLDHNCLCQGSVVFRREVREAVGLYDEGTELTEDYDLWLRMAEVTQIVKLDALVYAYRFHGASVSNTQRAKQVLHQALALDKALTRRWPGGAPDAHVDTLARAYLEAAGLYAAAGDALGTQRGLTGMLAQRPAWFESDSVFLPAPPTAAGEALLKAAFAALPATPERRQLLRRCLGRLHMREVFAGARERNDARVLTHWWPAVRQSPQWLLNRGALAIAARSLGRRLTGRARRPGAQS